jgi:hypothetical protein
MRDSETVDIDAGIAHFLHLGLEYYSLRLPAF